MNDTDERLEEIERKIDYIINLLENDIKKNCTKMGGHIDFVENVYDNVKNPLEYICNKVNYYRGNEQKIENSSKE
tara:strand:- start:10 stop:234 length:225 start_codon:yes stop_codon:yes gene_type:complete